MRRYNMPYFSIKTSDADLWCGKIEMGTDIFYVRDHASDFDILKYGGIEKKDGVKKNVCRQ